MIIILQVNLMDTKVTTELFTKSSPGMATGLCVTGGAVPVYLWLPYTTHNLIYILLNYH